MSGRGVNGSGSVIDFLDQSGTCMMVSGCQTHPHFSSGQVWYPSIHLAALPWDPVGSVVGCGVWETEIPTTRLFHLPCRRPPELQKPNPGNSRRRAPAEAQMMTL